MSPRDSPSDRRQSRSSIEPSTPLRSSFNQPDSLDIGVFASGGVGGESGLGNLADELADAFSDSGDEGDYYDDGEAGITFSVHEHEEDVHPEDIRDSGVDVVDSMPDKASMNLGLPLPYRRGHRRAGSEYDGSEYGSESDLDSPGMPTSLVSKISAVEALARRGTETTGGPSDGVFQRVTDGLRDLGPQTGVESSATRLITAHSALTTHLTHQTRQLQTLAFPLLSPFVAPPDPETIDSLLPLLISLSEDMPRPSTAAFNSLTALHSLTSDLINTLNYLSDTLHMSRQTTTTATRRLKSAKELVAEMRREDELREEGEQWIQRGNWSQRLENRECATVCGEVVGGFEEVCNGWRARLLAQAESAQA
ncbi:Uncharacterized protein SAPIO_CDS0567 [Scedosporium apiospermum]|uniref:WD domain-containing protein n=1 Tax=Pseudallescheria apiosperma TaxID=563466 RepID=A0A084GHA6_PSEDA|nr:Uncharacterized protein SAPIO_CDS0567 [Scedosporium apiospermum]KEZ46718.1 Uncharacterized protein SAPIO_CDS0567 [Scedosporium apiospermum]